MTSKLKSRFLSESDRQKIIDSIISFFQDERDEEIGIVAASEVLNFIESTVAPKIYAKAVDDLRLLVKENAEHLDFTLAERAQE